MLIDPKEMSKYDALQYLELNQIRKDVLEMFDTKFYNNENLAILKNVIMLRRTYETYIIVQNHTLSALAHNPVVTDNIKIEITLSLLDTDEEKLAKLEELIRGW